MYTMCSGQTGEGPTVGTLGLLPLETEATWQIRGRGAAFQSWIETTYRLSVIICVAALRALNIVGERWLHYKY